MPTELPPNTQQELQCRQAYTRCLDMESTWKLVQSKGLSPLVCARVLGQLILQGPSVQAREYVAREINSCDDESDLKTLAKLFIAHFICWLRPTKGLTPIPSDYLSTESWNAHCDSILQGDANTHISAKIMALRRDRYRCFVSNKLDASSVIEGRIHRLSGDYLATTHLSHILPAPTCGSINNRPEDEPEHHLEEVNTATILHFYGGIMIEELKEPSSHRLQNVLSLSQQLHTYFNSLSFWLEETENQNEYRPKAVHPFLLDGLNVPKLITFTTPDAHELPLPHPRYLRLHAACARVACMSGAAEALDSLIRDAENTGALAEDGGSADHLTIALANASIR